MPDPTSPPAPDLVLLTGATGYLGRLLRDALLQRGLCVRCAGRHPAADVSLDLSAPAAVARAVAASGADLVINAAALSTMGGCDADPDLARAVNTDAVRAMATAGPRVLQVSTDLVFDGDHAPYAAHAAPRPTSVYGRTKAAAEEAVVAAGGVVARIPLLFGPSVDGGRGATDMIRRATGTVRLFRNEFRTPMHVADAARGLVELALEPVRGTVRHLAGPESLSRLALGERFVVAAGLRDARIEGVDCSDPARPRDVSLRTDWDCGRSLDEALAAS